MPYSIEKVPDAPIVILVHESKQLLAEMGQLMDDVKPVLDAQPEPVFLVMDVRGLGISVEDLAAAASAAARGPGALLHHPNVRENLIVSTAGLVKLGAQGLRTATFGNTRVRVFDTTEQALDYCSQQIAQAAPGMSAGQESAER
jgi:hypothetical protein